jgi:MFS transporter, BCD family, chlorophyll transporter
MNQKKKLFGWFEVFRVGLMQACLGAVVVLATSTLNRVMVIEAALPALVPGLLVTLHYAVQIIRPRMGFSADRGGRRTPWIIGGMALLAVGGILASAGTVISIQSHAAGIGLMILAFIAVGVGVSACGTALLTLLAIHVPEQRRAASATVVWIMMIVGFAVTAGSAGELLEPFSPQRLVAVCSGVSICAFFITCIAVFRLEGLHHSNQRLVTPSNLPPLKFWMVFKNLWADTTTRRFTIFVFVSMLAYSTQDLILEPFAGLVLGYSPGQSTSLSGFQHTGVLVGMLIVAFSGGAHAEKGNKFLRFWVVLGCAISAFALSLLALIGFELLTDTLFKPIVFTLGVANGAFSIAAIGSMMSFASANSAEKAGTKMGLWGAAQAIAFALGGLLGTGLSDLARFFILAPGIAYGIVFAIEAILFLVAVMIALNIWSITGVSALRQTPYKPALNAAGGE